MIKYDIYETFGAKSQKYARIVEKGAMTSKEIAQNIADGSTFKPSEVLPIIECVGAEIVKALKNGYSVHLDGLGYFNLHIKGEIVTNAKGTEMLRNAEVTNIRFRPEKKYLNLFHKIEIQREKGLQHGIPAFTDEEILSVASRLSEPRGMFTAQQLESALRMRKKTIYRLLKRLVEEKKLEKISFSKQQNFYRILATQG